MMTVRFKWSQLQQAADAFCSTESCAAGIAIGRVEAGQSIATQWPQSERTNCTHGSELGGTLTDVSRGADVTPVSALNPAYEYALPPHLAQATQCRRFHDEICEADSGGTVVRSPYTVDLQAGDAVALDENSGRDKAVLAGASVSHQTPSAIAPAAAVDVTQHATDTTSSAQAATRLQQQLDSFSFSDLLLGKFEVLGPQQRRRGGAVPYACGLGSPCMCMQSVAIGVLLHCGPYHCPAVGRQVPKAIPGWGMHVE